MKFILESLFLGFLTMICMAQKVAKAPVPTNVSFPWKYSFPTAIRLEWQAESDKCAMYIVQLLRGYTKVVLRTYETHDLFLVMADLDERTVYGARVRCVNGEGRKGRFSLPVRTRTIGTATTVPPTTPKPSHPVGDCGEGYFTCQDGNCIPGGDWCNKIKECYDGSDEMDCPGHCEAITEFHTYGNHSCSLFNSPDSACFFDCDKAFQLVGPYYTVCKNGEWTRIVPTCRLKAPTRVAVIRNETSTDSISLEWRFQSYATGYVAPIFRALGGDNIFNVPIDFKIVSGISEGNITGLESRTTYAFTLAGVTEEGDIGFATEDIFYGRTVVLLQCLDKITICVRVGTVENDVTREHMVNYLCHIS